MISVSVIIVNYNGRHFLAELLDSLARQTRQADEIILVDNRSTDGSVDYLRRAYPAVRTIVLPTNVGFAAGNNLGVEAASGDYLALLNSDTIVEPRWLEELTRALDSDARIGAAVPKIYRASSPLVIEQAGAEFNNLGHCWARAHNEVDCGQYDTMVEVPVLTACSVLLRRAALAGEAPFDSTFFMYYEEFELNLRIRSRDYSVWYVPTAVVQHKGMQSVKQVSRQPQLRQQFYCNRNRLKILFKYVTIQAGGREGVGAR